MTDPTFVQPDETILIFHDHKSTYLQTFRPEGRFECHLGLLRFPAELPWGAVLRTNKDVPMTILRPTHAETMARLKRRTTVVYSKEAGRIVMELGVREGGRYAEVGSGSGALTSVLASMVGERGCVYSCEREAEHLQQAEVNVKRQGLSERVRFAHRDVARQGFGVRDVDGVFIDVPAPWTIVPAAYEALCGGAPMVSLSPTIDQVVRTEQAMFDAGFARRKMMEIMERQWKLFPGRMRPDDRMVGHTAFLLVGYKVLDRSFLAAERPR